MKTGLCPDPYCSNPFCRCEHVIPFCAFCNQYVHEEDWVQTSNGVMHEDCADCVYPAGDTQ